MSVRKNLIYSILLTLSTYFVPLLVFPYISRILKVDGIGLIDTVDGVIDYCILFSMMGMSTLGIREISRNRNDKAKLSETFSSLFVLNAISTFVVVVALFLCVLFVPHIHHNWKFFCVGALKLIGNLFWIEWFFKGLEDFKYITIRSVLVRLFFVIAVFVLIHKQQDLLLYYILFVGIVVANAFCNWLYKGRFVAFSFNRVNLSHYIKPFLVLGGFAVFSAIYVKLSPFFLSFFWGSDEVGAYTTATRFYQIAISVFSAMTAVMIPRMSILVKEDNVQAIQQLVDKVFFVLLCFSLAIIAITEFFAPSIIYIFAGSGYERAIDVMRLVIFQLLIIGAEQIVVVQLLIPLQKEKQIVVAAALGVFLWGVTGCLLVPSLGAFGSCIAWMVAELSVLTVSYMVLRRVSSIRLSLGLFFRVLVYSTPYFIISYVSCVYITSSVVAISIAIGGVMIWSIVIVGIFKRRTWITL